MLFFPFAIDNLNSCNNGAKISGLFVLLFLMFNKIRISA